MTHIIAGLKNDICHVFLRKIAKYWYLCVGTRVNHEHIARTQYKGKLGHVTMVDYIIQF